MNIVYFIQKCTCMYDLEILDNPYEIWLHIVTWAVPVGVFV